VTCFDECLRCWPPGSTVTPMRAPPVQFLAIGDEHVAFQVVDQQAPVAIRLATRHPERVDRIAFTYPLLRLPRPLTEMVPEVL
jgi:hypothetical protein